MKNLTERMFKTKKNGSKTEFLLNLKYKIRLKIESDFFAFYAK